MYYWREGGRRSQHPEPSNFPTHAVPSTMEYTGGETWPNSQKCLKSTAYVSTIMYNFLEVRKAKQNK